MTHECPGCGRLGIPRAKLACPGCWYRLPVAIRSEILAAWQRKDWTEHRTVLAVALAWYRGNPPE